MEIHSLNYTQPGPLDQLAGQQPSILDVESFPLSLAGLSPTASADTQLDVSTNYHCTVLNPLINYSDVMFARQQVKYTLEKKI